MTNHDPKPQAPSTGTMHTQRRSQGPPSAGLAVAAGTQSRRQLAPGRREHFQGLDLFSLKRPGIHEPGKMACNLLLRPRQALS